MPYASYGRLEGDTKEKGDLLMEVEKKRKHPQLSTCIHVSIVYDCIL